MQRCDFLTNLPFHPQTTKVRPTIDVTFSFPSCVPIFNYLDHYKGVKLKSANVHKYVLCNCVICFLICFQFHVF